MKKNDFFKIILLLVGIVVSLNAFPQFVETGVDPFKIQWRQIETTNIRLVYDSAFENEAQRLAAILDYGATLTGNTLHQEPKKISVIVRNYNAYSNGEVVWAPKRMEIYPVSPQDIYAQDWFEQLAVHENRHVAQINRLNVGLTSVGNIFFGQAATGASTLFLHRWFLEGDAVTTETALTNSGRGREPSFEMEIRTYMLEKHNPMAFKKAVMGSFKDYVPDYYQLGYLMVAYNRIKYGPQLWEHVLDETGESPVILFPFYAAVKQQTGFSRTELYNHTLAGLDSIWQKQDKQIVPTGFSNANVRKVSDYTSYRNPCFFNEDIIIADKTGMDDIDRIVLIDILTGKEKVLFTPGVSLWDNLSLSGKYLVWAEIVPHPRWDNCNYSVIRRLNIETGSSKYLSQNSRYFAPSASPDGETVATVEIDVKGQNAIILIDMFDGHIISKFNTPKNCAVQLPSWDENSKFLIMTFVNDDGKGLLMLDVKNGNWQQIAEPTSKNISQPRFAGNYIIYRSGISGIDNIYALNLTNKKVYQVTSVRSGAYDPCYSAYGQSLAFANYSVQGYNIAIANFDTTKLLPVEKIIKFSNGMADKISSQEPKKFDPKEISYQHYNSKPYSKIGHLFNVHSWVPLYANTSGLSGRNDNILPGFVLFSQNLQGTLVGKGGVGFARNQVQSSATLTYQALYSVFELSALGGDSAEFADKNMKDVNNAKGLRYLAKMYVPLNFSRGEYITTIQPSIQASFDNIYYIEPVTNQERAGLTRFGYSLDAQNYQNLSTRDLIPNLGGAMTIFYSHPAKAQYNVAGNYFMLQSNFYLPGFFPHQGLKLSVNIEQQDVKPFGITSAFAAPRGYMASWGSTYNNFSQIRILSGDYIFPICYPDFQALGFIFFKRIRGDLYYENTQGMLRNPEILNAPPTNYTTSGFELTTDFNLFYIPVLINFGIRAAYKIEVGKWTFEPVFNFITNF
jgi:hypothetical protein